MIGSHYETLIRLKRLMIVAHALKLIHSSFLPLPTAKLGFFYLCLKQNDLFISLTLTLLFLFLYLSFLLPRSLGRSQLYFSLPEYICLFSRFVLSSFSVLFVRVVSYLSLVVTMQFPSCDAETKGLLFFVNTGLYTLSGR